MRKRIATTCAAVSLVLFIGLNGVHAAASTTGPDASQASITACFSVHRQAQPLTTLAQARVCAPNASVLGSASDLTATDSGAFIVKSGKYYSVVYQAATNSAKANVLANANVPSSCAFLWMRNFAKQNWWFGDIAGTYQPYGYWYSPPGCYHYANMVSNQWYFSWCICLGWSTTQGTYDSNWAAKNGYGYWAAAWVNGWFQVIGIPPLTIGFYCRGEINANGYSISYPGCQM